MHNFHLQIISPEKKLFDERILSINLKTKSGEITILAKHIPMISLIETGKINIKKENGENLDFYLHGGSIEIREDGEVVLLVDEILNIEDLDLKDVEEKLKVLKEAAEIAMKNENKDFAIFEGDLEKYLYLQRILKNKK